MSLLDNLSRPIAYHRCFVDLTGSVTAAVMLSQFLYWSKRADNDGWFYKTREEWKDETGLSRDEQETSRRLLVRLGFISEKKMGMPARLFFILNKENIEKALAENSPASWRESTQHVGGKPAGI